MAEPPHKGPLSPSEIARRVRDPKTKIVLASQASVEALQPYTDRVMDAVRNVTDIGGAVWISDESCLSDFFDFYRDRSQDQTLYDRVGEMLGVSLDRANDDDHFIVKIALKVKLREGPPS